MEPRVSVLLCVFNPDIELLEESVDSIMTQTFEDWEMILYDDGSEEEKAALIKELAERDARIRYIRNDEHHCLAYGLNQSIKLAKGEYIARMDADDISHPRRLMKEVKFLDENQEYGFVGCCMNLFDEKGLIWGNRPYPEFPERDDYLSYSPYPHPAVMFRKQMLMEQGAYKDAAEPGRGEDYELFMRLYAAGVKGCNLQENLFFYRESAHAYRKRKLKFQLQEVSIRANGFKLMGLSRIGNLQYVVKPLVVWMVPNKLLVWIKSKR